MSQHSENNSETAELSHLQMPEHDSDADEPIAETIEEDNELDHETMDSEAENMFDGIYYPAPHQWEHTYLHLHSF